MSKRMTHFLKQVAIWYPFSYNVTFGGIRMLLDLLRICSGRLSQKADNRLEGPFCQGTVHNMDI